MMKRKPLTNVVKLPIALLAVLGMTVVEVGATPLQTRMIVEPAADTYIHSSQPTANFGQRDALELGHASGSERRILIRFDLSQLEEDVRIESAELLLRVTQYPEEQVDSLPIAIHRVLTPWKEGDEPYPGRNGATWNHPDRADDSAAWAAPGAGGDGKDRAEEAADVADFVDEERLVILPGIPARLLVLDVTQDMRLFQQGEAPNHGWLISIPDSIDARIRFNSKDAGEDARHPRLRITYRNMDGHH